MKKGALDKREVKRKKKNSLGRKNFENFGG